MTFQKSKNCRKYYSNRGDWKLYVYEPDLLTLASRIEQMEGQHVVMKKYLLRIKHELDNLIDKFEGRPEVQLLDMQSKLVDLQKFYQQKAYSIQSNARITNYALNLRQSPGHGTSKCPYNIVG